MGALNSPYNLGSNDIDGDNFNIDDDIYKYPCSADCKLIQKQYEDDPTTYPRKSTFRKWSCSFDLDNPIDWHDTT